MLVDVDIALVPWLPWLLYPRGVVVQSKPPDGLVGAVLPTADIVPDVQDTPLTDAVALLEGAGQAD